MEWTDDEIERLRSKWGKVSVITIAAGLGKTKGAVVGKAQRLGLQRLSPGRRQSSNGPSLFKKPPKDARLAAERAKIKSAMIPLRDIGKHQCRYILGASDGPDTVFCGNKTVGLTSWCKGHLDIVTP